MPAPRSVDLTPISKWLASVNLDALNQVLIKNGLPAAATSQDAAGLVATISGIRNQGDAAVLLINMSDGRINADELTKILRLAFPTSKVGDRHGPHYLSLARTGKLAGVHTSTPIAHAKGRRKVLVEVKTEPAKVEAKVEQPEAETPPNTTEPVPDTTPAVPEAEVVSVPVDLRAELMALSQKDLAARAKAVGVKSIGKREVIVNAIMAVS